ncbi:MAG: LPXTG cell wall anchor domain-containing protein [Clostridiales bacterium]|nr:LPXTG cell wall anchor domain-containing protein [Clostridiales bacterium]
MTTLEGAVFELYSADDVNSDGTLKDGATALYTATSDENGYVKFVDVDGNDKILESGTYYVFETTAPDGYVLPDTNYWTVTVDTTTQTVTFNGGNTALLYSDDDGNYYILNYKEYELPLTGGIGTGSFTAAGLAIMVGAVAVYLYCKRRRYEEE